MSLRKYLVPLLFAVATASVSAQSQAVMKLQGKAMPSFSTTDTGGKVHTNKSLKGKVILMDFWATWCVPCIAATPMLERLHKKYGSKGLVVIGADTWEQTNKDKAAAEFKAKRGLTYTFTKNNDALAKGLGIGSLPAMILIDKKGVVQMVQLSYKPSEEAALDAKIKKLLGS